VRLYLRFQGVIDFILNSILDSINSIKMCTAVKNITEQIDIFVIVENLANRNIKYYCKIFSIQLILDYNEFYLYYYKSNLIETSLQAK